MEFSKPASTFSSPTKLLCAAHQFSHEIYLYKIQSTLSSTRTTKTTIKASILTINLAKIRGSKIHMASTGRVSLIVAASIGTVEAPKDQAGLCQWNYALRSMKGRLKQNMGCFSQVRKRASGVDNEKAKRSEESLRMVMYLSCWGSQLNLFN
jgi:Wound-induced protein